MAGNDAVDSRREHPRLCGRAGWMLVSPLVRLRSGGPFERLNRREAEALRVLPAERPSEVVTALSTVARGGGLWLVIAAGLATRPGPARYAARDGAVAVGLASASAHLVSRVLARPRPSATHLSAPEGTEGQPRSPALPSAHASVAAAFITALIRRRPAIGVALLPLAGAVGYSRIRVRVHWPTDVLAGAAQGVVVGEAVHRLFATG